MQESFARSPVRFIYLGCFGVITNRLLITSIMLATKFFDDRYYNNEYYAKVGGIGNQEINLLERDFLQLINFRLYIAPILFFRYRERLLESFSSDAMMTNN